MRTITIAALAAILLAGAAHAAPMSSYTTKVTPVGADSVLINDSEDANATKKATLSSIVAMSPSMTYPGAGVPLSTGSAWGTSYTVGTAANNLVQLNASAQLPAVSGALLTNLPVQFSGTENTSGTAGGLSAQYIDWTAASGGASIANKPTLGTAAALDYGTDIGDLVRLADDGDSNPVLPFAIDLSALTDTTGILTGKQTADEDLTTWAGVTPGTGVATALAAAVDGAGGVVTYDADLADLRDGSLTGTKVGFADTDGLWTATNVQAALEELNDSINTGSPNGAGAKVHWSQLTGVPAGFADGTDAEGSGGGISHATSDGTYYASRNGAWSAITSGNYTLAMTLTGNTAVTLPTSGTLLASGGALGTPSSGTLTNASGLPLSGVVDSTTEALGVGTLEVGAASDTTLARSAAGIVTVESVPLTRTIASGTVTFNPSSVSSGSCSSAVTDTGTGTATTDVIDWTFASSPVAVTGYNPSGDLGYIVVYPTANTVNFAFCNKSGNAIDPGTININWKVLR